MKSRRTHLAPLIALLLCLAVFLPGCISTAFETKINSDGSGQRILDVGIDESLANVLDSSANMRARKGVEGTLKANMPKGAKYKKFSREGKVHHQITFDFEDFSELNKINKRLEKDNDLPKTTEAKLAKSEFGVFANYEFTEEFPSKSGSKLKPEEEQMARAITVTYKLTMPGKILKAEGTKDIENDTATWQIDPVKGGKIKATSRYIRWWLIALLAIVLILAMGAGAVSVLLAMRRKKAAGKPGAE